MAHNWLDIIIHVASHWWPHSMFCRLVLFLGTLGPNMMLTGRWCEFYVVSFIYWHVEYGPGTHVRTTLCCLKRTLKLVKGLGCEWAYYTDWCFFVFVFLIYDICIFVRLQLILNLRLVGSIVRRWWSTLMSFLKR